MSDKTVGFQMETTDFKIEFESQEMRREFHGQLGRIIMLIQNGFFPGDLAEDILEAKDFIAHITESEWDA